MKYLLAFCTVTWFAFPAFAMPIDFIYSCISRSAKYKIETSFFNPYSKVEEIRYLEVAGKEIRKPEILASWDGDRFFGLVISLPNDKENDLYSRALYIEGIKIKDSGDVKGIIQLRGFGNLPDTELVEPAEPITCKDTNP